MKYKMVIETNKEITKKEINCELKEALEQCENLIISKLKKGEKYIYGDVYPSNSGIKNYKGYVYFVKNGKTKGEWK